MFVLVRLLNKVFKVDERARAEILTSTPVKKLRREKFDKKIKERVYKSARKQETSFCEVRSAKKTKSVSTPRYFYKASADPCTEPPKGDWIQCYQYSLWSHKSCTSYSGRGSCFCDECFDLICVHSARFINSLHRGTQGEVINTYFSVLLVYLSLGIIVWSSNMLIKNKYVRVIHVIKSFVFHYLLRMVLSP
jgi:hypothetical protein